MTIRELIEDLSKHGLDTRVLVDSYEDGCEDPKLRSALVYHEPGQGRWAGNWQEAERLDEGRDVEDAVVIGRLG